MPPTASAEIAVPTLITHDLDDRVIPFAAGEWLATQIPGAIFKEVPGSDHFGLTNPDWRIVVDAQLEFICGSISAPRTERRFATVVFTDIVESTQRTAREGDEVVASHPRQPRPHRLGDGGSACGHDRQQHWRWRRGALRRAIASAGVRPRLSP